MTRTQKRIAYSAALLVAAGGVAAVLGPSPVMVDTAAAVRRPLQVTVDEEGQTRVVDRYVVAAPVGGRVSRIAYREGDSIRSGMVLAWVYPAPLDARAREQGVAKVAEAEDAQRAAAAQVDQADAAFQQARRTCERAQRLAAASLISPEERERCELEENSRHRELESAQFRAQATAHDVELARAALLSESGHPLPLRAPVRGRILRVQDPSERVVAAGTPLLEVGDPRRIEIVVDFLSSDAVKVHPGDVMRVEAWGGDTALRARVSRVEPSGFTKVSALGVEEQRVNVIGVPEAVPAALGDRYRVDVHVVIWEGRDVLQIPASALFRRGPDWGVFVIAGGRALYRKVRIGHRAQSDAEVVEGLREGEQVIRDPTDQVEDGVRVRGR